MNLIYSNRTVTETIKNTQLFWKNYFSKPDALRRLAACGHASDFVGRNPTLPLNYQTITFMLYLASSRVINCHWCYLYCYVVLATGPHITTKCINLYHHVTFPHVGIWNSVTSLLPLPAVLLHMDNTCKCTPSVSFVIILYQF